MRDLRNRVIVLVALTLGASACAAILGIDDVTIKDGGESGPDGSTDAANEGSITDASVDTDALADYATAVLSDGPVGYWRLGDTDVIANNAAAVNLNGTYGDTITHTVGGGLVADPNDNAAIFPGFPDGSTQLLGVAISKDMIYETEGTELTIEVWVEPQADVGDDRIGTFVSYGTVVSAPFQAWVLKSVPPTAAFFTSCCGQVLTETPLVKGKIYYLVATFDHGVQAIYVNGALDSQLGVGTADLVFDASTDGLGIGSTWHGDEPFNGILDEVAIYKKVLPLDRIRAHYSLGMGKPVGDQ